MSELDGLAGEQFTLELYAESDTGDLEGVVGEFGEQVAQMALDFYGLGAQELDDFNSVWKGLRTSLPKLKSDMRPLLSRGMDRVLQSLVPQGTFINTAYNPVGPRVELDISRVQAPHFSFLRDGNGGLLYLIPPARDMREDRLVLAGTGRWLWEMPEFYVEMGYYSPEEWLNVHVEKYTESGLPAPAISIYYGNPDQVDSPQHPVRLGFFDSASSRGRGVERYLVDKFGVLAEYSGVGPLSQVKLALQGSDGRIKFGFWSGRIDESPRIQGDEEGMSERLLVKPTNEGDGYSITFNDSAGYFIPMHIRPKELLPQYLKSIVSRMPGGDAKTVVG